MTKRLPAIAAACVLLGAACSLLPQPSVADLPRACEAVYSKAHCEALTDTVAADIGKNRDDVASTLIVPDPVPKGAVLGGAWHILVRIALKDGSTHDMRLCAGVAMEPACTDDPHLWARSAIDGYRDVPEGSTPLPSLQAAALSAAIPIIVDRLSIPIDRTGTYEVVLGEGGLPDGVWSSGSFEFIDSWPHDLALRDGKADLVVRSVDPSGKPFENIYMHGWRPGVERVRAILAFDVLWFAPGASLDIQNVVVR